MCYILHLTWHALIVQQTHVEQQQDAAVLPKHHKPRQKCVASACSAGCAGRGGAHPKAYCVTVSQRKGGGKINQINKINKNATGAAPSSASLRVKRKSTRVGGGRGVTDAHRQLAETYVCKDDLFSRDQLRELGTVRSPSLCSCALSPRSLALSFSLVFLMFFFALSLLVLLLII